MTWKVFIRQSFAFSFIAAILFFLSSCECKHDKYGEILELEIPFITYPMRDTFTVGDTLWLESHFEKEVSLRNSSNTIRMDSFNFFTEFIISEISDSTEDFSVDIDTVVKVGRMEYLPLQTAVVYPLTFLEETDHYHFKAGIIMKTPGLFFIAISTPSYLYEESYDHPLIYVCNNNIRDQIEIYYNNPSTTLAAYNNLFLSTKVDYLKQLTSFENYRNVGGITIVVK